MIIIGLGNPGKEYEGTRHNVGFTVLDRLIKKLPGLKWKKEFGVEWCNNKSDWLIKPQQYMNVAGATLYTFQQKKKLGFLALSEKSELLVVHDDIDFPLGEIHEQFNRSAAGHNGIQSIIDVYGQEFYRLRIGIGNNRALNIPAEDYVLQKFSVEEKKIIDTAIEETVQRLIRKIEA